MVQFYDPTQEAEIKRRRRMAEMLQQQGQSRPTEVVSGYAVPQSGFEGLARGLAGFAGGYEGAKADMMEQEQAKQRQQLADALIKAGTREEAAAIMAQDPSMINEAMRMKYPTTAIGGATGQIADRLIAEGVDPLEAILIAKSGIGVGRTYDANTRTVAPMAGAPEAGGAIKYGEEAGKLGAQLELKPQIQTAEAIAKDKATAMTTVGGYATDVANNIQLIDNLLASPGFESAVGPIQSRLPNIRGTTADADAMIEQIKGVAFLDSIQEMRGLGALSNAEGDAATRAATRMKNASSEQGFREAAEDYKAIMTQGLARMQAKAGVPQQMPQAAIPNRADPLAAARDAMPPEGTMAENPTTGQRIIVRNGKWEQL
jgi:hypothetical protein